MALIANNDNATVTENLQVSGNVTDNDLFKVVSKVSIGSRSISVPRNGSDVSLETDHGTRTINRTGQYTFVAHGAASEALALGQAVTLMFRYDVVFLGLGKLLMATDRDVLLAVTVTGANDRPMVTAFSNGAVTEDASALALSTTVSVNFTDPETSD